MQMQRNTGRNGGTEVLGTMSAVHAPMVQDFQCVKFRTTGDVSPRRKMANPDLT